MSPDRMRALLDRQPFEPSTIYAGEEGDFEEHTIDVFLVTRVSQPPSRPPRGRRKAS